MWQKTLQARLGVATDGILGPISFGALFLHMGALPDMAGALGRAAARWLPEGGISHTPYRLTEWVGEMAHESMGFSRLTENLTYSTAERLRAVWPSRFPSVSAAAPYVRNPERLANKVYANRLGNGPENSGDGWRYRGRGLIQLTGRDNYRRTGQRLGLGLEAWPDMVAEPDTAVRVAVDWWLSKGVNAWADRDESNKVSGIINRGNPNLTAIGLADRLQRKERVRRLWR